MFSGLTSLLFLSLMVVDPALSTLSAHYEPEPAECRVIESRHVIGNSNTNSVSDLDNYSRHERVFLVLVQGGMHRPALGVSPRHSTVQDSFEPLIIIIIILRVEDGATQDQCQGLRLPAHCQLLGLDPRLCPEQLPVPLLLFSV